MARPGGKEVGRVAIRTVPDGTKFRKDLKIMLDRAERTETLSIQVRADVSSADADLRRFDREWNGKKITLDTAVASAGSTAALKVITRPRVVPLVVKVSKASALKAANLIAALSGARVAGDLIENLTKKLGNLDRALPKIALVALSVASIGAAALSSVGGVFTLATGLAQIVGVGALLPGLFFGFAAAAATLALALSDTKNQLGDLAPGFQNLRSIVVDNFWAKARQPIRNFVGAVLPELNRGLGRSATALGTWSASVAQGFQKAFGGGALRSILANVTTSINIASTGTGGFASALTRLGVVGAAYLPRLASWTADLSNRFAAFVSLAESDGSLVRFINNGLTATRQLGSALFSVGQIIEGISTAAQSAGGGGLATFASTLAGVAAVVMSPAFQTALSTIFGGAASGVSGLATALAPLGSLLSTLAPLIAGILSGAGAVVGEVLGQIADALQSPAFQIGLGSFFDGLLKGIQGVAPALPALATSLGTFLQFAGKLATVLGPVLGAVLIGLAPVLDELLSALQPFLPLLGEQLVTAIQTVAPSFLTLAQAITPLLPQLFKLVTDLLPVAVTTIQDLALVLGVLMTQLGPTLDLIGGLTSLMSGSASFVTAFLSGASAVSVASDAIQGKFGPVVQFIIGQANQMGIAFRGFVSSLQSGLSILVTVWNSTWSTMGSAFASAWTAIISIGRGAINSLASFFVGGLNTIVGVVNTFLAGLRSISGAVSAITGGVINFSIGSIPKLSVPHLSVGADVLATPGGVLARLGEGGRNERVIDAGLGNAQLAASIALAKRALGAEGSPRETNLNLYGVDPMTVVSILRQDLRGKLATL